MMDKAKAYDEALKRAKEQRDDYQKELDKTDKNSQLASILKAGISALEMVFPQLKDSDDERVRKSLIEFLTDIKEISESGRTVWAVRENDAEMCKSFIAYLEKQKECIIDNTSEDEKMLQTIIQGFKNWKANGMESFNGTKIDDILVYLEKRKYNRMQPVYDNQESFESALDKAWKVYNDCGSRTVDSCEDDYIESAYAKGFREGYLFGLEKQKEQKPVEWSDNFEQNIRKLLHDKLSWYSEDGNMSSTVFIDDKTLKDIINGIWFYVGKEALKYPGKELNVTEWSEEDKRMFSRCIKSIECSKKFADSETYKAAKDVEINWLKDIFLNHKKFTEAMDKLWSNDWSEDDETCIRNLESIIYYDKKLSNDTRVILGEFLNNLRKRLWKPSEEQIEALERTTHLSNFGKEENRRRFLLSLLKELKKLGVEEDPEYYQHFDPDC